MSDSLQLRLVTPSRLMIDERVREVTAPGTEGEIGILPEHITFLGALDVGILTFRTDRGTKRVAIRGGFAEFTNEVMTVLADDAVFPEDVNAETARREAAQLESELESVSQFDSRYADLRAAARWARLRADIAVSRAA